MYTVHSTFERAIDTGFMMMTLEEAKKNTTTTTHCIEFGRIIK